jgi:hypothetical protein
MNQYVMIIKRIIIPMVELDGYTLQRYCMEALRRPLNEVATPV